MDKICGHLHSHKAQTLPPFHMKSMQQNLPIAGLENMLVQVAEVHKI